MIFSQINQLFIIIKYIYILLFSTPIKFIYIIWWFIAILDGDDVNEKGLYKINNNLINIKPLSALIVRYL